MTVSDLPKIIFLSFLFFFQSFPQNDSTYLTAGKKIIIDSIHVFGNDITDEDIILRELTFGVNDTVNKAILNYNKERVYSLGLFTKVELLTTEAEQKNILEINVEESWYIYPLPVLNLRENDWNKLSYGFYLVVKNFRGRNETLIGRAEFGYDPAFGLSYYKPSIVPGSDFFWGMDFLYRKIANKSITAANLYGDDFEQQFIMGTLQFGKRFGVYQRLNLSLSYNYIESPKFIERINASNQRIDHYPSIGIGYTYDTRDLLQFPKEGIYGTASVEFKGLGFNDINYQVTRIDFREYRNLFDDLIAKWRIATRLTSSNLIPYYDYSLIGYDERIRGSFNLKLEGNNYYLGSLEMFYPLLKDMNITLDFIPIVPKELLSYRIGLYIGLFGDLGATKVLGKPISTKDFRTGYGVGLNLLVLPYNILRFELAFDKYRNTEFLINLGLSF